ncbi:MAG: substrate-binding domain-containing protein, partial [Nitrospirota bacterium]|nr:substrate-binding domain-containing protein [Nitrospirota bacterium]
TPTARPRRATLNVSIAGGLGAILLLLSACSTSGGSDPAPGSTSAGKKTIAYVGGVTPNDGYDAIYCGLKIAAEKAGYSTYNAGPSAFTASAQLQALEAVILRKPSAIVLGPVTPESVISDIESAVKSGIPVAVVASPVEDSSKAFTFVNPNVTQGGQLAVDHLATLLPKGGEVAIVGLDPTNGVDQSRVEAYKSEITKHPELSLVATQYVGKSANTAAQAVSALLLGHPGLDAILVSSTTPSQGVAQGIESAGKKGDLKAVGYGIEAPPVAAALKAGILQSVISQNNPGIGQKVFNAIQQHLSGQAVPRSILSPENLITMENINSPDVQTALHGSQC